MVVLLVSLLREISNAAVKQLRSSAPPRYTAVRDTSAIAAALVVLVSNRSTKKVLGDLPKGTVRNLLFLLQHAPAQQCSDFAALLSLLQEGRLSVSYVSIHCDVQKAKMHFVLVNHNLSMQLLLQDFSPHHGR